MLRRFLCLFIMFFCMQYVMAQPMDAMISVGQGNSGALTAITELYKTHKKLELSDDEFEELLNFMHQHDLVSSNIWILYKYILKQNAYEFFILLKAYHQGILSNNDISSSLIEKKLMFNKSLMEQVSMHYYDKSEL